MSQLFATFHFGEYIEICRVPHLFNFGLIEFWILPEVTLCQVWESFLGNHKIYNFSFSNQRVLFESIPSIHMCTLYVPVELYF